MRHANFYEKFYKKTCRILTWEVNARLGELGRVGFLRSKNKQPMETMAKGYRLGITIENIVNLQVFHFQWLNLWNSTNITILFADKQENECSTSDNMYHGVVLLTTTLRNFKGFPSSTSHYSILFC